MSSRLNLACFQILLTRRLASHLTASCPQKRHERGYEGIMWLDMEFAKVTVRSEIAASLQSHCREE